MVNGHPKPRYSGQMESGVLYFVAKGKAHIEKYGGRSGNKHAYPVNTGWCFGV